MSGDLHKLAFLSQYGSPDHKAKYDGKVHKMIAHGDGSVVHRLATSADLPLSSEHIHKIIDRQKPDTVSPHPAEYLSRYHFGDMKDEHFDKIARHSDEHIVMGNLPHLPLKHLKTVATLNPNQMPREFAAMNYRQKKAAGYPE